LFLEEIGEWPYRIDRCLVQLSRCGILKQISGIVLGEFTNCNPAKDGTTVEQVVRDHFKDLNIPVATGYPAAHGKRNFPFVHGKNTTLEVSNKKAHLHSF